LWRRKRPMHDGGNFSSKSIKKRPSEMKVFFL
jgi:hypothetical protein